MDLNEIVVFAKVVETGSFTAAAQALGLPKSTVSRKLAQLEERLDARLLQRTTRKLRLTDVGRAYYERCAQIVADLAAAEQVVAELQASPRGLLRVTAPIDLGGLWLGALAAEFLREQPDIQLELVVSDQVFDLVDERLDVALRFGPLADSSLVVRRLGAISAVVVGAPAYLDRRGAPTHPTQLSDHDTVAFVPVSRFRTWSLVGPGGETFELALASRLTANSVFAAREAVLHGAGLAVLPDFTIAADVAAGRLVRVLPGWGAGASDLSAVYPSTRNMSPKLRVFLDFVIAHLSPPPWQGGG
jgi:DNA-binding transcriptional LysR family regulator